MHALYIQKIKFNDKIYLKLKCNHYIYGPKEREKISKGAKNVLAKFLGISSLKLLNFKKIRSPFLL